MEKHKSQALALAEKYCRENGISYAKLKEQRFECLDNFGCFLQSSEIEPQGLKNDMATMPKITLIFKIENGKVSFEQTEYTEKYIGKNTSASAAASRKYPLWMSLKCRVLCLHIQAHFF